MKQLLDFSRLNRSKRIGVLVSVALLAVAVVVVACSDVLVHSSPTGDEAPVVEQQAADAETFVMVEQMPELVGGLAAIQQNLKYPDEAKDAGVEGRVIVQFVVDEKGFVVDPIVVRGIGSGLDEAAVSAVQTAKFKPGMQDGKAVPVQLSLPVTFKLAGSEAKQDSAVGARSGAASPDSVDEMPTIGGGLAAVSEHLQYPEIAKKAGIQGQVVVQFVVDEDGRAIEPEVMRGLGSGLDQSAIDAVRAVRFTPGKKDGKPVKVKMALPITFKLADEDPGSGPERG